MAHTHKARTKHTATSTADSAVRDLELFTTDQVAKLLKISARTLKQWRSEQRGPKYYIIGHRFVRYKRSDLIRWQQRLRVDPLRP